SGCSGIAGMSHDGSALDAHLDDAANGHDGPFFDGSLEGADSGPRDGGGGVAKDCTLYAAADGNDDNNGLTQTTPKTLDGASSATVPGSVVCLKGGAYNRSKAFSPAHNGTSDAWIVYKAYGDAPVNFVWMPAHLDGGGVVIGSHMIN